MTLKETLAALDAAATQGELTVCMYDCGDTPHYDINGPCPSIQSESEDCAIVHWDGFKQEYWSSANGNQKQIVANAELIVALVNLYRTGQLVVAPSVEEVARVLERELAWSVESDVYAGELTHEERTKIAKALLTSMGAKTDGN